MMARALHGPRLALAGRVLVGALALAYAVTAGFVALDRAADQRADLAAMVPAPFVSVAAVTLAQQAIVAGQQDVALRNARLALAASPADGERSGLLGAAYLVARDGPAADKAFLVSARTGWRAAATQSYMMTRAVELGQYDDAAERADALLRQQDGFQRNGNLMVQLEGNLNAHDAFLRRLAMRPPWLQNYIGDIGALPPEQIGYRVAILAELAERGMRLGCAMIDQPVHQLIHYQSYDDARELWNLHCPEAARVLVWDGNFVQPLDGEQYINEFRWQLLTSGNLDISMHDAASGGGHRIAVTNSGEFPAPFLRQLLVVPPGRYLLRWDARNSQNQPSTAVSAAVNCGEIELVQGNVGQAVITFPAQCSAANLEFSVAPGHDPITFGGVNLVPQVGG